MAWACLCCCFPRFISSALQYWVPKISPSQTAELCSTSPNHQVLKLRLTAHFSGSWLGLMHQASRNSYQQKPAQFLGIFTHVFSHWHLQGNLGHGVAHDVSTAKEGRLCLVGNDCKHGAGTAPMASQLTSLYTQVSVPFLLLTFTFCKKALPKITVITSRARALKSTWEIIPNTLNSCKAQERLFILNGMLTISFPELSKTDWHHIQWTGRFDPGVLEKAWLIAN